MGDYFAAQAIAIAAGRKCAQSEASEKNKIEEGGKQKNALAHNRAVQMMVHGDGDNGIHLMGVIATCNPKLAEAREMVTKYIKESEDMKILGGGVWALRRHGCTVVVIYMVSKGETPRK
jgi:hypothetical protein